MITKIFFQDKPVFLCDEITPYLNDLKHHSNVVCVPDNSEQSFKFLLKEISKPSSQAGIIYNVNFLDLKEKFYSYFKLIKAAGGLIKKETGELLFIFRRGKWDLPKGKNDGDETAEQCALREVMEETGLTQVYVQNKICTTYHTYKESGEDLLKETDWFNMTASSGQKLIPQEDESIEKIEWVPIKSITNKLKNSFPLIADVLMSAGVNPEA